jgi:hypothetical protein
MWLAIKENFELLSLRNGGRKPTTVPNYIREEPKDDTTSGSIPNNSNWDIRCYSLTLVFIYSVMVSFITSGKARI